ncbi:MAG TPA: TRAM domain-containing protein, partial [Myxococcaceae bacterium]|nr:TRAM domain-containing protein [Myxococcaceae bacterium]
REQNKKLIGKRLEVLVEGPSEESEHLLVGRFEGQAPEIDGMVYINDGMAYPGEFVTVEVTEAHDYDLVAKVVERPDPKQRTHKARTEIPSPPPTWMAPR